MITLLCLFFIIIFKLCWIEYVSSRKLQYSDLNSHYDVKKPRDSTDAENCLQSFLEGNNLVQMIEEPTRVTQHQATILDVVITSCPSYFTLTGTLSPPSNCDHSVIFAHMYIRLKCH
jgi:hypothetical protein